MRKPNESLVEDSPPRRVHLARGALPSPTGQPDPLEEYVRRAVASAPPLSLEQRARLALLLRPPDRPNLQRAT